MAIDVGGSVRRVREERGYSLRVLADRSGLAINTLSLIENGISSPSVSTLQQLAVALEIPITALFETGTTESNIAYMSGVTAVRRRYLNMGSWRQLTI